MKKINAVKLGAGFIVGVSVGYVVKNALNSLVVPNNALQKAELFVGTLVIGGMINKVASDYINNQIDNTVKQYEALKEDAL